MAAPVDRPPPNYPSEEASLAAPPHLDVSQGCDTFKHAECRITRPPTEIASGPNAGRWSATWICNCPCHRPKETPE